MAITETVSDRRTVRGRVERFFSTTLREILAHSALFAVNAFRIITAKYAKNRKVRKDIL